MTERALKTVDPICPKCGMPCVPQIGRALFVLGQRIPVVCVARDCLWEGESDWCEPQTEPQI